MRKYAFIMILLTMLFCSSASAEDMSSVHLFIDGQEINMTTQPQIIDGVLMIPAEDVITELGANVQFDAFNNTINIEREGKMRYLQQLSEIMDEDPNIVNLINDVLSNYLAENSFNLDDSVDSTFENTESSNIPDTDLQNLESSETEPYQESLDNSMPEPDQQNLDTSTFTPDPDQQNLETNIEDDAQIIKNNPFQSVKNFFVKLFVHLPG